MRALVFSVCLASLVVLALVRWAQRHYERARSAWVAYEIPMTVVSERTAYAQDGEVRFNDDGSVLFEGSNVGFEDGVPIDHREAYGLHAWREPGIEKILYLQRPDGIVLHSVYSGFTRYRLVPSEARAPGLVEEVGRLFREFTLATSFRYYFDPIAACTANASVTEQAAIVTNGLGLWYGSGYGKSFHGSANREEIETSLERLHRAGIPPTLHALADEMRRGKRVRKRDISEAELRLRSMRRTPQLSVCADPTRQLTFSSGFRAASLDYFHLPAHRDEVMPVNVGTMALAGILNEATTRRERNEPQCYAHGFVDESALLNGARTMESKLPIARKWLSMKLIYQYRSQWYEHGRYMPDSLASNCPVRIQFSASCEDDFRELELQSDEEPKQLGSFTTAGLSVRKTVRDEIRPRLERNKARKINRTNGWAYFSGSARDGDPLPFKIAYATTVEEHKRLSHMPITPPEDTPTRAKETPAPPAVPVDNAAHKRRQHILRKILVAAKDRESWEPKGS